MTIREFLRIIVNEKDFMISHDDEGPFSCHLEDLYNFMLSVLVKTPTNDKKLLELRRKKNTVKDVYDYFEILKYIEYASDYIKSLKEKLNGLLSKMGTTYTEEELNELEEFRSVTENLNQALGNMKYLEERRKDLFSKIANIYTEEELKELGNEMNNSAEDIWKYNWFDQEEEAYREKAKEILGDFYKYVERYNYNIYDLKDKLERKIIEPFEMRYQKQIDDRVKAIIQETGEPIIEVYGSYPYDATLYSGYTEIAQPFKSECLVTRTTLDDNGDLSREKLPAVYIIDDLDQLIPDKQMLPVLKSYFFHFGTQERKGTMRKEFQDRFQTILDRPNKNIRDISYRLDLSNPKIQRTQMDKLIEVQAEQERAAQIEMMRRYENERGKKPNSKEIPERRQDIKKDELSGYEESKCEIDPEEFRKEMIRYRCLKTIVRDNKTYFLNQPKKKERKGAREKRAKRAEVLKRRIEKGQLTLLAKEAKKLKEEEARLSGVVESRRGNIENAK